jgi:hypothetical protein
MPPANDDDDDDDDDDEVAAALPFSPNTENDNEATHFREITAHRTGGGGGSRCLRHRLRRRQRPISRAVYCAKDYYLY